MTKKIYQRRVITNARLPLAVIDAIERAAAENGTTVTAEIEARLVETLIADKLLSRGDAIKFCGAYAATLVVLPPKPR